MQIKFYKLAMTVGLSLSLFSAKAQTWDTVVNGINRSSITGLLPDCTETLHLTGNTILGSTTAGIYKSTNYGDNWTRTSSSQGYNGVRKVNSGRIIALGLTAPAPIQISDDNGDTWKSTTTSFPSGTYAEDLTITSNGNIFIATRKGISGAAVYVSIDNGDTWTAKSAGLPTSGISSLWAIESIDNDTLVAGEYSGFYRSTDAGANWTKVKGTGTDVVQVIKKHPNGTLYAGLSSNFVMKSTDNGLTWNNSTLGSGSAMVYDIEFDKSANIYVGIFGGGITKYASDETLSSILASPANGMTYPRVQDIMIDESGSTPIFMAATLSSASVNGYFYRYGYTGTSINEKSTSKSFSIYPNPAQNTVQIAGLKSNPKTTIIIYSMLGKKLIEQSFSSNFIDINELANGLYILQVKEENGATAVQRFEK